MFLTTQSAPLAAYVQLPELKADATLDLTKKDGSQIDDDTLKQMLLDCSGELDDRIGQSFLPQEETIQRKGDGTFFLTTNRYPLIYLKQVKVVLPSNAGVDVPIKSLKVDYQIGLIQNMAPLVYQIPNAVTSIFPWGTPIDITLAWGIGYPIPPPQFTAVAASVTAHPFSAGSHTIKTSTMTYSGESLPSNPIVVNLLSPGSIFVNITTMFGGMRYFVYVDDAFAAEIVGQTIGDGSVSLTVDASPPTSPQALVFDSVSNQWVPRAPATVDSSFATYSGKYAGLKQATKMLVQQKAWEQKNPANQGILRRTSGPKTIMYKDAMRGANIYANRIDDIVESLKFKGIV